MLVCVLMRCHRILACVCTYTCARVPEHVSLCKYVRVGFHACTFCLYVLNNESSCALAQVHLDWSTKYVSFPTVYSLGTNGWS